MALGLSGCASSPDPVIGQAPVAPGAVSEGASFSDEISTATMLRPMDELSLLVQGEPEYSLASVRIAPDGFIDVPAIGRVKAAGRTSADVAAELTRQLSRYLVDPRVALNVTDYGSHKVTVEGSVNQPGVFTFEPNTTLLGAVAMAKGPTRVAKLNQVAIFRNDDGQRMVAVFDLRQVRSGQLIDPVLHPGDKVVIGFSGMAQAQQDFLQAVPLIAIFTRF